MPIQVDELGDQRATASNKGPREHGRVLVRGTASSQAEGDPRLMTEIIRENATKTMRAGLETPIEKSAQGQL